MKSLDNRHWFLVLTLAIAMSLMAVWWHTISLPVTLAALGPFIFGTIGLWLGIGRGLAVLLIRYWPNLGAVGPKRMNV